LEHSLLRPVLKISYPPQEVLAHVRAKRQQKQGNPPSDKPSAEGASPNAFAAGVNAVAKGDEDSTVNRFRTASEVSSSNEETPEEGKDGKSAGRFKPGYELYHVVKRILYRSLSFPERERIHGILQDFYMRERTQESENRILRVKNRALLAEAKFHGSGARGRKPGKGEKNSDVAAAAATQLPQTPYQYRTTPPLSSRQRLTLDDYKRLSLPDMGDEAETSLEGPTFTERLEAAATARPMSPPLSDLELTDEERILLHRVEPPTVMRQVVVPKALPAGDSLEEQLRAEAMQASQWLKPSEPKDAPVKQAPEAALGLDLQRLTADLLQEANADEQEKDIQQRLAAAVARQDRPCIAQELLELARNRSGRGRYQSAAQCLEKAHSLRGYAKKEVMAEIYRLSGSVNKETYHHNTALASLTKAAAQIKRLMYEDETVNAIWLGRLGQVYQDLGEIHAYRKQFDQAVDAFSQALRWYHSVDDPTHEAEIHFQMAGAYDDLGQADSAIVHYEKALALDEAGGNFLSVAASLTNLGNLHLDGGRLDEARECFRQALQHDRTHQNVEGQLQDLECLMSLYQNEENYSQAENAAKQALTIALREGLRLWQASLYLKLAQLYATQANWPKALQNFERSRTSGESELSSDSLAWLDAQIENAKMQQAS
jgi:tetratricopeptide (TPR) repeat protein